MNSKNHEDWHEISARYVRYCMLTGEGGTLCYGPDSKKTIVNSYIQVTPISPHMGGWHGGGGDYGTTAESRTSITKCKNTPGCPWQKLKPAEGRKQQPLDPRH